MDSYKQAERVVVVVHQLLFWTILSHFGFTFASNPSIFANSSSLIAKHLVANHGRYVQHAQICY